MGLSIQPDTNKHHCRRERHQDNPEESSHDDDLTFVGNPLVAANMPTQHLLRVHRPRQSDRKEEEQPDPLTCHDDR